MAGSSHDLVIVGGGLTSARAVRSYREAGGTGTVALYSRDGHVPYHRPPLSKRYLRGEAELESTYVEPAAYYEEQGVELMLQTGVARVHPDAHEIELEGGERRSYGKLLLATGGWPRQLSVPGADLAEVTTFRTLDDSIRLREAATGGVKKALVVGGSFIGSEIAASLRVLGLDVTLVHRGTGIFDALKAPELSEELNALFRSEGVDLILGDEVAEFSGNGKLTSARTREGRVIDAEIAVVGIGVAPALDLLEGSGIEADDGVLVDEHYRTNAPDVFAAGDIARFTDPIYGRRRRIEHWSNANYQGTEVGKVLAGAEGGYDVVSSFFTEVFGFSLRVFGDSTEFDEVRLEGSVADREAVGLYIAGGKLVAALSIGQEEATESELKEAIASGSAPPRLE
jgi:3-phenylpropionate/trans-cinnamate dioxygenase ferredoxin reductase component